MHKASRASQVGWVVAAVLLAGVVAMLVGGIVARRARADLIATMAADARLRQVLLASEVARFRLLPLALSDDRDVVGAVGGNAAARAALDRKLETLVRTTGAAVIYLIDRNGVAIAASNYRAARSFVGQDYQFRRYYRDAVRDGAATQFALGTVSHRPGLYLSRLTREGGVVVVKLEFDRIEREWAAAGGITFVTDRDGVVLIASRPEWRFARTAPVAPPRAAAIKADTGAPALKRLPFVRGTSTIRVPGEPGARQIVSTEPDDGGWRVHLAMALPRTIGGVVRAAQAVAVFVTLALVALAWSLRERARRRARRTAELEEAVVERTSLLRTEIDERIAAEARAAELREGLRQANRLAALGQITASVAHETAQPVAAIRNYAAAARQLLDRGDTALAHDNLAAIARLTDRIGSVTAELRGFARKSSGTIGPIPLAEVVEGARLLLKERLSGVTLIVPPIPAALLVIAGRVRLEQVLVNLLQNATEALGDRPDPHIVMETIVTDAAVRVVVADNGPGIHADVADRLFTPFVTSRPSGLGLGLVIAQDIMADLGGSLRLVPSDIGARFELTLRRAA